MTMIDFEDSMTFTLDNQMNGLRTVTKAAARTLKVDVEGATIDLSACEKTSQILIRMEGLALPNPHFLVDSIPVLCNKSRSSLDMRWAADAAQDGRHPRLPGDRQGQAAPRRRPPRAVRAGPLAP